MMNNAYNFNKEHIHQEFIIFFKKIEIELFVKILIAKKFLANFFMITIKITLSINTKNSLIFQVCL